MTMYWYPRLKIIVYIPVRSKYVVPYFFVAIIKKKSCVLDSWVGDDSSSILSFVGIVLGNLMFCCSFHRWKILVLYYHKMMAIQPYPFLVVITQLFSWITFINYCKCILTGSPG